jgi:hypothetical protein
MRLKIKYIFFVFIFFLCAKPTISFGQTIKGKIVAKGTSEKISYASISIYNDTACIRTFSTDEKGSFKEKVLNSRYTLVITAMGYNDNKLDINNPEAKDIDFGDILLVEKPTELAEVQVTASRQTNKVDRMIVLPSAEQIKVSSNGLDLLRSLQLPNLFVDNVNQTVSISGTSGVIFRINGIPSSLQQVSALPADQILKIEYSQTPSSRELDTNSGIINVILKKNKPGTYVSLSTLGAITTGFLNGNTTVKTTYKKSEFSLDYNINWRNYSERWSKEYSTYCFPTDTINRYQQGLYAPFGYVSQGINLGYTYNNNSKNVFNVQLLNTIYNSFDDNKINVNEQGSLSFRRDIHATTDYYMPTLNLYYIRKYNENKGLELNLVGSLTSNKYKRRLDDIYPSSNAILNNESTENRKSAIFEIYYYNKSKYFTYSFGLRNSNSFSESIANSMESNFVRVDVYPYASISGKFKNLTYQIGSGIKMQMVNNEADNATYFSNVSNLNLLYSKNNKWNLRNTTQYLTYMPSLSLMNPSDVKQNELITSRGNTELTPYRILSDQLTFTYLINTKIRSVSSLFGDKTFDPIENRFDYDPSISTLVSQPVNQQYDTRWGASTQIQLSSLFDFLSIASGVEWCRYNSKGDSYTHELSNITWSINATAAYKDFSLNMGYRKPSKELSGQYIYLNENYSSVSLNYGKDNISFGMGVYYPFTSGTVYGTKLMSSVVRSDKTIYIKDNANMFYLRFSYQFMSGKSVFNFRKKLDNSDNDSAIRKVRDN